MGKKKDVNEKVNHIKKVSEIKRYLKNRINNSWYYNAECEYGISGYFIKAQYNETNDELIIYHKEQDKIYQSRIVYVTEYTLNQVYAIWQENLWVEV